MNNPNNVLITKGDVEDILNYFGNIGDNGTRLEINTLDFYQQAFVNETYKQAVQNYISNPVESEPVYINYIPKDSSEILEYLGDHILKATLARYLYERFSGVFREGALTRLKIKIEKCSMLHKIAVTLGFKKFLLLSLQIENQTLLDIHRGRQNQAYFEDAFESFLGSIMEDFGEKGYIYAERFIRNIIENVIDFAELINTNDNHKDSLQRFFQSLKWKTPVYVNINEQGPLYRKIFSRMLTINNEQWSILDISQQKNIKAYTNESLCYYKTKYPDIYTRLFKEVSNGNYILCIGESQKVVTAEQNAAKLGLKILNLDDNY